MICCFVYVSMMWLFSLVDFSFFTFMNSLKKQKQTACIWAYLSNSWNVYCFSIKTFQKVEGHVIWSSWIKRFSLHMVLSTTCQLLFYFSFVWGLHLCLLHVQMYNKLLDNNNKHVSLWHWREHIDLDGWITIVYAYLSVL